MIRKYHPRLLNMITIPGVRPSILFQRLCARIVADSRGFTLVEIIVAIAILALSAGVVFGVTSDSIRTTREARTMADATLLAQSLIARVGSDIPLREGETAGRANLDMRWRLHIARYGDDTDRQQWPVAAYVVVAEVASDTSTKAHSIKLVTIRLGPKEAER